MKITTKKYAQALLEAVDGKSEKEAKLIIARLLKIMAKDNELKSVDALIENFVKLWNKKNNISIIEVITVEKMPPSSKKIIKEYITQKLKAKEVELNEKIDKNILGGVIIREEDKIFDGSLKTRLYDFKEQIG